MPMFVENISDVIRLANGQRVKEEEKENCSALGKKTRALLRQNQQIVSGNAAGKSTS